VSGGGGTGVGRLAAFRARIDGASARRAGKPSKAVPYAVNGPFRERTLARYWMRGWVRADLVLREAATQGP
jgi:hypothetical protein